MKQIDFLAKEAERLKRKFVDGVIAGISDAHLGLRPKAAAAKRGPNQVQACGWKEGVKGGEGGGAVS